MVLGFDTIVADTAVVATRWAPDAAGTAVFYGDFKMDLGGLGRLDESPAIGGGNSECVVFVVGFKGVDVTRIDLKGVSTRCKIFEIIVVTIPPGLKLKL